MVYRIWRSPWSRFGGTTAEYPDDRTDETFTAADHYSDAELERIAAAGFNGIWVHARFAQITRTEVFPELGSHADEHIARLSALIRRAEKHGIKLFLYGQVLRAVPASCSSFWKNHAECAGQREFLTEESPLTG